MDPDQIDQTVHITSFAPSVPQDGSKAQLVILRGPERGRVIELHGSTVNIGRRLDNQVVLFSASISKYHAMIESDGNHHHLRDLGSTNGTTLNQTRLPADQSAELHHGDMICIGDHHLLYCQAGEMAHLTALLDVRFDADEVQKEVDALLNDFPALKPRPEPDA